MKKAEWVGIVQNKRLRGILLMYRNTWKEMEPDSFHWWDRTRGSGYKQRWWRLYLNRRKQFFTVRLTKDWKKLPWGVVRFPTLDILTNRYGLGQPTLVDLVIAEIGLNDVRGHVQPYQSVFLWITGYCYNISKFFFFNWVLVWELYPTEFEQNL